MLRQLHSLLIRGGRVIDPVRGTDEVRDLAVFGGVIVKPPSPDAYVIDASGCIVCPGLWDIHVHLREPGQSHKETIESGTRAAAAGGFTFVACMPNTMPAIDSADVIQGILEKARRANFCGVGPVAAITRGRNGKELTDFAELMRAGAVAFSDDGVGVEDDVAMRSAFERAATLRTLLIQHCEYKSISAGGVMHLGGVSRRHGVPGLDPRSEEAMIERDLELCRQTGGRYHVAHISTAKAVALVRRAKADGLPVTAEVCTHHLILTEEACAALDPNTKMHPPLRPQADVEACRKGLLDGTIDCIVTDHAPHTSPEKALGFLKAPAGISGLETALPLAGKAMVESGLADWQQVIRWFTTGPAGVLGRRRQAIAVGAKADLTIFDAKAEWRVDPAKLHTQGKNTPFAGWNMVGRVIATVRGSWVWFNSAGGAR